MHRADGECRHRNGKARAPVQDPRIDRDEGMEWRIPTQWPAWLSRLGGQIKSRVWQSVGWDTVAGPACTRLPIVSVPPAEVGSGSAIPDSGRDRTEEEPTNGVLSWWSRREQAVRQVQENQEHVNRLIEDIQRHLVREGERSSRICESLDQLSRSTLELPIIARQQAQLLETISGRIDTTNARTQQLAEAVSDIPRMARLQSESIASITRHLELAAENNAVHHQTMERLASAIQTLNESSNAQVKALWLMNVKAGEQNEFLSHLIARQSKLFVILISISALMAAASVFGAVASTLRFQQLFAR